MISSIYGYYMSQYGHKEYSKYDTHSKAQLKTTYSKVVKINSQTPAYKIDTSKEAMRYAIDLKENARQLSRIADKLSDNDDNSITLKRSAASDMPDKVQAQYIGNGGEDETASLMVNVSQLASGQINTSNFLAPNEKLFPEGDYSFDLRINDLTYQFEFNIDNTESVNDIQNKISRLINRSNIGLSSQILTDSEGNTALSIISDATGISGIKPTIFNIRENLDSADNQASADLVSALGLDRVTQYPSNAVFEVNGQSYTSMSNEPVIDKTFVLYLQDTTNGFPVNISLNTDSDAIADSIDELISGYNSLIAVTAENSNDKFEGNAKLKKEFAGITKTYNHLLTISGLNANDNGTIDVDRNAIISAANEQDLADLFNNLNSFKQAIQKKAEDISLDPMNYVNNKIIAYKNPTRTLTDPYNISAYTGMMFDGFI